MPLPIFHVDAFTDRPFGGNPAAVCILDDARDDAWMGNVAREMNLSETAFLLREGADWRLRWMTPAIEVDLCGHATLASAHVLWSCGLADPATTIRFQSRSGLLTATRKSEWISLDFPADPCENAAPPKSLIESLGVRAVAVFRSGLNWIVEVESESAVRAVNPDFRQLRTATPEAVGVIVTSSSRTPNIDFVSRFFAPAAGVDEDPATGSAHCSLGPLWAERLRKTELSAMQVSARGGFLRVRVRGDRVDLLGQAVTIARGELIV